MTENPSTVRREARAPSVGAVINASRGGAASAPVEKCCRPAAKPLQRSVKNVLDFVGALVGLALLSPLLILLALCIKLDDGGPVFYRRRVVGRKGEFNAFKFRTMRPDADAILAADPALRAIFETDYKLQDDPRITRVGALLRKYSLDELPQLLNVLMGQMSLVGPRMVTAAELQKYGEFRDLLLRVKPGLSGYWQVNGRQSVSYAERVKMDVYYLEHWSLLLDLEILLKTPAKVVRAEGAY
jgi:lipopolysaccharide/colanic/teichoic acid biosynthesis glycosyltransferase